MPEAAGVLVLGECSAEELSPATAEVIAAGRQLADALGEALACGLLGSGIQQAAQAAISYGADQVYIIDDPILAERQIEISLEALTSLCRAAQPRVVLMARTQAGRDVAPRLAMRLNVPLAQDCVEVVIDPETRQLLATRPVYGGNAMARVRCSVTPQFATVRPKSYAPLAWQEQRQGQVTPVAVTLDPSLAKTKVVTSSQEESVGVKLEDARIVVAGGRGLGGPEGFRPLEALAQALGAGIGASRAAVDSGWVPYSWQIGLTGKTITPDVYITVGISGASQHIAGCSAAKCIVAVNKDRDANIFRYARYGIVGDWQKVLKALTDVARELSQPPEAPQITAS